ncbi:MAG: 50S ribosomal protein L3, partial [Chloroflexota bacterium]
GCDAVQLGFGEVKKLNKQAREHLKATGKLFRHLRDVRLTDGDSLQVGAKLDVSLFKAGDLVDIVGTSKGRGHAGVVKRHHFKGGPHTHGQSDRERRSGSIGSTTTPGRVIKGMRMAGHMGNARVTVKHMEVLSVDPAKNLMVLQGAVPGSADGLVLINRSKKVKKARVAPPTKGGKAAAKAPAKTPAKAPAKPEAKKAS